MRMLFSVRFTFDGATTDRRYTVKASSRVTAEMSALAYLQVHYAGLNPRITGTRSIIRSS